MSLEYILVLFVMLVGTVLLDLRLRTNVFGTRLFVVIASVLVLFVAWDLLGTMRGLWWTPPTHVLGVYLIGIPLEEFVFLAAATYFALVVWAWSDHG